MSTLDGKVAIVTGLTLGSAGRPRRRWRPRVPR